MKKYYVAIISIVLMFFVGCGGGGGSASVDNAEADNEVSVTNGGHTAQIKNGQCFYDAQACESASDCTPQTYGYICGLFVIDLDNNAISEIK